MINIKLCQHCGQEIHPQPTYRTAPCKAIKPKEKMDWKLYKRILLQVIISFFVVFLFVIISYYSIKSITASGEVVGCNIEGAYPNKFALYEIIDHRFDNHIGNFNNIDEAMAAAEKLNCPLRNTK